VIDVSASGHYIGDCRALLRRMPDCCVQTIVTSPPFWGLRSYLDDADPSKHLEIGLEPTPEDWCNSLVEVFREARRVLVDDGTLWLNLGDCYAHDNRGGYVGSSSVMKGRRNAGATHAAANARGGKPRGYKPKDLIGQPWMAAFALRADGWYLRSDIIWHKPNPMPSPIDDRTTKAHEYVFLLSKSATYFYDATAIAEPSKEAGRLVPLGEKSFARRQMEGVGRGTDERAEYEVPSTRNCRSVWTIATTGYDGAHFATMPPALAERCVLAGSRPGDVVLDMFFGSGTTGEVAEKHGRRWIGFDINPEYEKLQRERTAQRSLVLGGGGS
jgi:site-specific DNA-methyltransferase (cytosine-N4-specific)